MPQTLIKWRLAEVMARYRIKGSDLAEYMGVSDNAISKLKKAKTLPRLGGERLNLLCNGLNKLAQDKEGEITPADLIDYSIDDAPPSPPKQERQSKQRTTTLVEDPPDNSDSDRSSSKAA